MNRVVVIAMMVEFFMIVMSFALLIQPRSLFSGVSERTSVVVTLGGLFSLLLTFCWSVLLGSLMAIAHMRIEL